MKLYILLKFGCFYEGNGSYKFFSLNKLDLDFYLLYVKYLLLQLYGFGSMF